MSNTYPARIIKEKYYNRFKNYFFHHDKENHDKFVFFKIDTLTEGKMFGIHHFILSDEDSKNLNKF